MLGQWGLSYKQNLMDTKVINLPSLTFPVNSPTLEEYKSINLKGEQVTGEVLNNV
jgi:hypothetical protein